MNNFIIFIILIIIIIFLNSNYVENFSTCSPCTDVQKIIGGICTNVLCSEGQHLVRAEDKNTNPYCANCPLNTYLSEDEHNNISCKKCTNMEKTLSTGSRSASSCVPDTCNKGMKLTPRVTNMASPTSCSPCPENKYIDIDNHQNTRCNLCSTVDCSEKGIKFDCTPSTDKQCYTKDEYDYFELPHPAIYDDQRFMRMKTNNNKYGGLHTIIDWDFTKETEFPAYYDWINAKNEDSSSKNLKWNFESNCNLYNFGFVEAYKENWKLGKDGKGTKLLLDRSTCKTGGSGGDILDPLGEWYMTVSDIKVTPYIQVTLPSGYDKVRISYRQPKGIGNAFWEGYRGGRRLGLEPEKRGQILVTLNDQEISSKYGPSFTETQEWGRIDDEGIDNSPSDLTNDNQDQKRYKYYNWTIARPAGAESATVTNWIDYTAGSILKIEGKHAKDLPMSDYYYEKWDYGMGQCKNGIGYYNRNGPIYCSGSSSPFAGDYTSTCSADGTDPLDLTNNICTDAEKVGEWSYNKYCRNWGYNYNCMRACSKCFINNTTTGDNSHANTLQRTMLDMNTAIGGKFKIEVANSSY